MSIYIYIYTYTGKEVRQDVHTEFNSRERKGSQEANQLSHFHLPLELLRTRKSGSMIGVGELAC